MEDNIKRAANHLKVDSVTKSSELNYHFKLISLILSYSLTHSLTFSVFHSGSSLIFVLSDETYLFHHDIIFN